MATYKEKVYKGWSEGLTAKEISEKYSINKTTVWTTLSRLGVKSNKHKHPLADDIARLYEKGETFARIAKRYNMSERNAGRIYHTNHC